MARIRTVRLEFTVSPEEAHMIRERAALCGKRPARYVWEVVLGVVPKAKAGAVEREAVVALNHVGVNLNQVARWANRERRYPEALALDRVLDEILTAIRRLA